MAHSQENARPTRSPDLIIALEIFNFFARLHDENYLSYDERKEAMDIAKNILNNDDVKKIKLTSLSDLTVEQGLQHGLD